MVKFIVLGLSFALTIVGVLLRDLTDLTFLPITLIVWGLAADFGVFLAFHREEDW